MATKKISSYQKLKQKIAKQKEYIRKLEQAIYAEDIEVLTGVKMRMQMHIDTDNMIWYGESRDN